MGRAAKRAQLVVVVVVAVVTQAPCTTAAPSAFLTERMAARDWMTIRWLVRAKGNGAALAVVVVVVVAEMVVTRRMMGKVATVGLPWAVEARSAEVGPRARARSRPGLRVGAAAMTTTASLPLPSACVT